MRITCKVTGIMCLLYTVLIAAWEEASYTVYEEDMMLLVCVTVSGAAADRPVTVLVMSEPDTAEGIVACSQCDMYFVL